MTDVDVSSTPLWAGASRTAEVFLRNLGGTRVALCTPAPISSEQERSGLGLQATTWQEVVLEPVLVRQPTTQRPNIEVVVAAETLEQAAGMHSSSSTDSIEHEARLRVGDALLRILKVVPECLCGRAYLYRIRVEG